MPFGDRQQCSAYRREAGGGTGILSRPHPRLRWPIVGNMHRRKRILRHLRRRVEGVQPTGFRAPGLTPPEGWDLSQRGPIWVLVSGELGDRSIGQDSAGRFIQLLSDGVPGVPELGDVCQAAPGVDMMNARGTAPGITPRLRTNPCAGNECGKLLFGPWPLACLNEPSRELTTEFDQKLDVKGGVDQPLLGQRTP